MTPSPLGQTSALRLDPSVQSKENGKSPQSNANKQSRRREKPVQDCVKSNRREVTSPLSAKNASPLSARIKAALNPLNNQNKVPLPRWKKRGSVVTMNALRVDKMKSHQQHTLHKFRAYLKEDNFEELKYTHFDWWMFPMDSGSRPDFLVHSFADVDILKGDTEWHEGYLEAVRSVALCWGWNVDTSTRISPRKEGQCWDGHDIRLSKMIRSLWLFREKKYFLSMRAYAHSLIQHEKKSDPNFVYGGRNYNNILHMSLNSSALRSSSSLQSPVTVAGAAASSPEASSPAADSPVGTVHL